MNKKFVICSLAACTSFAVFSFLTANRRTVFSVANEGKVERKYDLVPLLKTAWVKNQSVLNVVYEGATLKFEVENLSVESNKLVLKKGGYIKNLTALNGLTSFELDVDDANNVRLQSGLISDETLVKDKAFVKQEGTFDLSGATNFILKSTDDVELSKLLVDYKCQNGDVLNVDTEEKEWDISLNYFGLGTESSPYEITTIKDLELLNEYTANGLVTEKFFALTNDIGDETNPVRTVVGNSSAVFNGTFDGANKQIYLNLVNTAGYQGVFGKFDSKSLVKNLIVDGSITSEGEYAGGIVGTCNAGHIINCVNKADISSSNTNGDVGGITGFSRGVIENCKNYGDITGVKRVGGIVGRTNTASGIVASDIKVTGCYNEGEVRNTAEYVATTATGSSDNNYTGLFVGSSIAGSIVTGQYGTLEHVLSKAATCSETGLIEHYTNGEKYFSDQYGLHELEEEDVVLPIDPSNHSNVEGTTVLASYATDGSISGHCNDCDEDVDTTVLKAQREAGGFGSEENPFTIANDVDIEEFAADVRESVDSFEGKFVKLLADVNLNSVIGVSKEDGKFFVGTFDGNGKTITADIEAESGSRIGVFSYIAPAAVIKNLTVAGSVTASASNYVGGIVGSCDGNIINCHNSAAVTGGAYVAGIAGYLKGAIASSSNTGTITAAAPSSGSYFAAGICGMAANNATLTVGSIKTFTSATDTGTTLTGTFTATIVDCWNEGNITALNKGSSVLKLGGVVGVLDAGSSILGCYNKGVVDSGATNQSGGVIGYAYSATPAKGMSYCYQLGTLTGFPDKRYSTSKSESLASICGLCTASQFDGDTCQYYK